jgi:hypothetical protein
VSLELRAIAKLFRLLPFYRLDDPTYLSGQVGSLAYPGNADKRTRSATRRASVLTTPVPIGLGRRTARVRKRIT